MYHLHDNIYDSAQQVSRNQYKDLDRDDAIMIFSFYPTKPVAGCDGGMVVSNNKEAIDWYKMMTLNGTTFSENNWDRKHITPGFKMHCNSIQAFIANESLKKLDKKNERLEEIRDMYNNSLGYTNTSNHLYRVRVRSNKMFINTVGEYMSCGIHYEECHKKEFYGGSLPLPRTESESPKTLSIPFHDHLTNNQVKYIISKVRDYVIVG
jgi:dTDP-4-amino-4,6-dideoxygalactose transaminase